MGTAGISDEDRALIRYLELAAVPHRVTSTTNHSVNAKSGNPSRHRQPGTNGLGLAVDFAGLVANDARALRLIFDAFDAESRQLFELIYSGAPYSIKAGRRVPRYAIEDHWNHVHVAVNRGTFLVPPAPSSPPDPPEIAQEPSMRIIHPKTGDDSHGLWWVAEGACSVIPAGVDLTAVAGRPVELDETTWRWLKSRLTYRP